jgi:hypothetical protein
MDYYETRSYPGWHRHMTLVFLAMRFQKLTFEKALIIIDYYTRRNHIAYQSPRKRKLAMLKKFAL